MRRRFALSACLFALAVSTGPAAIAQTGHGAGHGAGHSAGHGGSAMGMGRAPAMSAASQAYMDAMKKMDRDMAAMPMSGEPGVDFAAMMIPHHQAAIDMAKAYLASGENDPAIAKLSREIIEAQEREIAFLKSWLAARPKR